MRPATKALLLSVVAVVAAGVAWLAVTSSGALELDRQELARRYALPTSKFVTVDKTPIHYVDEGQGPVVVLMPPSFMNLRAWDGAAADLSRDFRVIRLDFPLVGLSGPDPGGDYSTEHFLQLLHGLMQTLEVPRFSLVGTSSGGTIAFQYAARWPEQVERLVLINNAGLPRSAATDPNRARGSALSRWLLAKYKPRSYWKESLDSQMGSGKPAPESVVTMVYDLNRRSGIGGDGLLMMKQFRSLDPQAVLSKVRAPTLILWGKRNITLSHLEADVFEHWLTGAPSMVHKYDELGHYPYIEAPELVAGDIRAFLRGERDGELAQTTRVPYVKPEPAVKQE